MFSGLSGMPWPQANEDILREVQGLYVSASGDFDELADSVGSLVRAVSENFHGESAEAFLANMRDYVSGPDYLGTAKDQTLKLAEYAENYAAEVEYAKWMILAMLIQLAAELAELAVMLMSGDELGAIEESEQVVETEIATQIISRTLLRKLLKFIGEHVVRSVGLGIAMDGVIQAIQIAQGHRHGWSWDNTVQTLEFSAVGTGVGLGLGPLGKKLGSFLKDALGNGLGKGLGKDLGDVFDRTSGPLGDDGGKDLGNDLGKVFGDNGPSLADGFGKGGGAKDAGIGDHVPAGAPVREALNADIEKAVAAFEASVADTFEQHLADALSAQYARELGAEFARAFAESWGGASLRGVKEALASTLEHHTDVLGEDGVKALSHEIPDALVNRLAKQAGPDIGAHVADLLHASAMGGINMTLTQGFYGVIFDPEHTFTVSASGTLGGVAMGGIGHLGRLGVTAGVSAYKGRIAPPEPPVRGNETGPVSKQPDAAPGTDGMPTAGTEGTGTGTGAGTGTSKGGTSGTGDAPPHGPGTPVITTGGRGTNDGARPGPREVASPPVPTGTDGHGPATQGPGRPEQRTEGRPQEETAPPHPVTGGARAPDPPATSDGGPEPQEPAAREPEPGPPTRVATRDTEGTGRGTEPERPREPAPDDPPTKAPARVSTASGHLAEPHTPAGTAHEQAPSTGRAAHDPEGTGPTHPVTTAHRPVGHVGASPRAPRRDDAVSGSSGNASHDTARDTTRPADDTVLDHLDSAQRMGVRLFVKKDGDRGLAVVTARDDSTYALLEGKATAPVVVSREELVAHYTVAGMALGKAIRGPHTLHAMGLDRTEPHGDGPFDLGMLGRGTNDLQVFNDTQVIDLDHSPVSFGHYSFDLVTGGRKNNAPQRQNDHLTIENSLPALFSKLQHDPESVGVFLRDRLKKGIRVDKRTLRPKAKPEFNNDLHTSGYGDVDNFNFRPALGDQRNRRVTADTVAPDRLARHDRFKPEGEAPAKVDVDQRVTLAAFLGHVDSALKVMTLDPKVRHEIRESFARVGRRTGTDEDKLYLNAAQKADFTKFAVIVAKATGTENVPDVLHKLVTATNGKSEMELKAADLDAIGERLHHNEELRKEIAESVRDGRSWVRQEGQPDFIAVRNAVVDHYWDSVVTRVTQHGIGRSWPHEEGAGSGSRGEERTGSSPKVPHSATASPGHSGTGAAGGGRPARGQADHVTGDPFTADPRTDERFTAARLAAPPVLRSRRWVDPVSEVRDAAGKATPLLDAWGRPVLTRSGEPVLNRFDVRSGFDVRRFEFDGETVTDLTVRVRADTDKGMSDQELAGMWQKVESGVAQHLNAAGYRLSDGDKLHVTVERVSHDEAEHLKVGRVDSMADMTQHAWSPDAEPVDFAHEISHQLGLRDEYRDDGAEQRLDAPGSLMGDYTRTMSERDLPPEWREEFRAQMPVHQGLRGRHLQLIKAIVGDVPLWRPARAGTVTGGQHVPAQGARSHDGPARDGRPRTAEDSPANAFGASPRAPRLRYPPPPRLADEAAKDDASVLGHVNALLLAGRLSAARVLRDMLRQQAATDPVRRHIAADVDRIVSTIENGFAEHELGHFPGAVEIPKTVNFVWLGRPMKEAAISNVAAWAAHAKEAGWKVTMWTDTGTNRHNTQVSKWDATTKKSLTEQGVEFREVTDLLPERPVPNFWGRVKPDPLAAEDDVSTLRDIYQKGRDATEAGVYPMLSDAARYAVLWREGGVYADVDIAPGGVDLRAEMPRVGVSDIPYLPPMIRDRQALDETKALVASELGKPVADVTLKEAANYRVDRAEFANNFFVLPPGSELMAHIMGSIAKSSGLHDVLDASPDELSGLGAALTGPSALARALRDHFDALGAPDAEPHEQAAALDPGHSEKWSELGWITEESDNQEYEGHRSADPSTHRRASGSAPHRPGPSVIGGASPRAPRAVRADNDGGAAEPAPHPAAPASGHVQEVPEVHDVHQDVREMRDEASRIANVLMGQGHGRIEEPGTTGHDPQAPSRQDTRPSTGHKQPAAPVSHPPTSHPPARDGTPGHGRVLDTGGVIDRHHDGPGIREHNKHPEESATPTEERTYCGDPIDVATGQMKLTQTDVELAGLLPLVVSRTHLSGYRLGGWFGPSWASTLDQRVEIDDEGVCFAAEDGALIAYPSPGDGTVLPLLGPAWPLARTAHGGWVIADPETDRAWHFAANGTSRLPIAAVIDGNGQRIDMVYDDAGDLVGISHSAGYRISVQTEDGLVTGLSLLDPTSEELSVPLASFGYDRDRRLTAVHNSSAEPMRFGYDDDGRIVRWDDRNGAWYTYTFDADGRCVATEGARGFLTYTFDYDRENLVTTATDSLGNTTVFGFDERLRLVRQTDALGNTTGYERDPRGRVLAVTDPLDRVTRHTYDAAGNLVTTVRPDGSRILTEYNAHGRPVTHVESDGTVWRTEYDEAGRPTAEVDPSGARTAYGYDERGDLATVTDGLGGVTRIERDDAGQPVAAVDPLGARTSYAYDQFGRVTRIADSAGGVTWLAWTVEGLPLRRMAPDGAVERWTYDGEGSLRERVDAQGLSTRLETTHFDLTTSETGPDGARLEYGYDTQRRLTTVTNQQGLVWRYDYDAVGNLVRETDFDGRVVRYRYDAAGQLTETASATGQRIRIDRDVLGREVRRTVRDAERTSVTTFAYDAADRLVLARDADTEVSWRYDALGRVLAETVNGRTVASAYDALGRRTRRTTPSGALSVWEYDAAGRPASLSTAGRTVRFGHDVRGREVSRRIGAALRLDQVWDANDRLSTQVVGIGTEHDASVPGGRTLQRRQYRYRADGRLAAADDALAGPREYELDDAGRITGVRGPDWSERYDYDPAGNITDAQWPAVTAPAGADGPREYSGTLISRAGTIHYEHDTQGRMVARRDESAAEPRTWRYSWAGEDRLVGLVDPDERRWRYRYDPLGRRIAKERLAADGTTAVERVDFFWDGADLVEQLRDGERSTVWERLPGSHRVLSQTERVPSPQAADDWVDERFHAVVTDLVGTPTELVDEAGALAWRAEGTVWGAMRTGASGDADIPLRFPGQYHDAESGLHYNVMRYYDPATGRYASTDPLGLLAGPNPRAYVANPTGAVDPLGLMPDDCDGSKRGRRSGAGGSQSRSRSAAPHRSRSMFSRTRDHSPAYDHTVTSYVTQDSMSGVPRRRVPDQNTVMGESARVAMQNANLYPGAPSSWLHGAAAWAHGDPVYGTPQRRDNLFAGTQQTNMEHLRYESGATEQGLPMLGVPITSIGLRHPVGGNNVFREAEYTVHSPYDPQNRLSRQINPFDVRSVGQREADGDLPERGRIHRYMESEFAHWTMSVLDESDLPPEYHRWQRDNGRFSPANSDQSGSPAVIPSSLPSGSPHAGPSSLSPHLPPPPASSHQPYRPSRSGYGASSSTSEYGSSASMGGYAPPPQPMGGYGPAHYGGGYGQTPTVGGGYGQPQTMGMGMDYGSHSPAGTGYSPPPFAPPMGAPPVSGSSSHWPPASMSGYAQSPYSSGSGQSSMVGPSSTRPPAHYVGRHISVGGVRYRWSDSKGRYVSE
ncbi:DUF6531 domain-containing protein [Streptomyces sp. IBSBF 2435]|uniref:DUF6531 domain-containing protein n=1 Tax=Streptomyces sp. IBSBF 2435 TaxID=2903531 RepID=UPI002FDC2415